MKITRKQVLMAVRYEPLTSGNWVRYDDAGKSCGVCAVGATLRKCGVVDKNISALACNIFEATNEYTRSFDEPVTDAKLVSKHLSHKNYLAALSCYFEGVVAPKYNITAVNIAPPEAREELATWVEKNIPARFTAKELKAA